MVTLEIVHINTGQPQDLEPHPDCRHHRDRRVTSSLVKRRVTGVDTVEVDTYGLQDNRQADVRVHGGHDKAMYAYPYEHLETWGAELDFGVIPGESFGENLTVRGALEHDIFIGDTFQCGEVVFRVTGPRRPCYKLGRHMGDAVPRRMIDTGRCGWYFSVVVPGKLPIGGASLTRIAQCEGNLVSVAQAFAEKMRREPGVPGPRE